MRPKTSSGGASGAKKSTSTKLPKLVITKFNGPHTDWLNFWGQLTAEINESDAPRITKFSYLKELIKPKVRTCINGLPFTSIHVPFKDTCEQRTFEKQNMARPTR